MQVEPIINARFKQFRQKNELEKIQDSLAFEKFVNYTIYSLHHPDAFSADTELLEFVSVGGANDMGIDGIAIKVEDIIVKTKDEIDDIIKFNRNKRINVEFIFIQSKYKTHFDKGELNNFVDGVRDFLADEHNFPMNDNIKDCLKLKEYLLSDEITIMWDNNPNILLYYVGMGRWKSPADLVGIASQFARDISYLNVYNFNHENLKFIDSNELKEIYDSIQNTFNATIDTRHSMPLTDVKGVSNACLSIVYASELIKLISTDDGIIRKSLFNDNVRDFQGLNPVNLEIENTVRDSPEKFIVLNNGITIVCDEYKQNNTKLTIYNPQIVNGCQTSHIIYECFKKNLDLSKVPISVRVISSTDEEIVNDIVRGTNRQNIVLEEAFESTKKFHKDLEEFFIAVSPDYETIYYERRSKQYQHNPTIKQTQKINLRILTQYYIGIFLNKSHISHRHESVLLKENKDDIFQDYHSKLPYFTVAYTFIMFERYLRDNSVPRIVKTYKSHILMMFRQSIMGYFPSQHKETEVDKACNKLLAILKDNDNFKMHILSTINLFMSSLEKWETELGKSKRGTKDVEAFTLHLINEVNESSQMNNEVTRCSNNKKNEIETLADKKYLGKIISVVRDRYNNYYGFIEKSPNNIFIHSKDNENFDFSILKNRQVLYTIVFDKKSKLENTKQKAIIDKVI